MGTDTKGRLLGNIKAEDVLNFINQKYDINSTMNVDTSNYGSNDEDWIIERYDDSNNWIIVSGFINFQHNGVNRRLHYYKSNINSWENLKLYSEYGLEDMIKSETTNISLGCWGDSVEIIKDIVTHFGGWIDENDCDDKEFYPILKNEDGNIKPIIYITKEELYEKFGGIVIIKK